MRISRQKMAVSVTLGIAVLLAVASVAWACTAHIGTIWFCNTHSGGAYNGVKGCLPPNPGNSQSFTNPTNLYSQASGLATEPFSADTDYVLKMCDLSALCGLVGDDANDPVSMGAGIGACAAGDTIYDKNGNPFVAHGSTGNWDDVEIDVPADGTYDVCAVPEDPGATSLNASNHFSLTIL